MEELISVRDAAILLKLSKMTVYTLIRRGELPAVTVFGHRYGVRLADVQEIRRQRASRLREQARELEER